MRNVGTRFSVLQSRCAKRLREHAVHLLGMAIQVRDLDPEYGDRLVAEAIELEDQAKAIEEAAKKTNRA